MSKKFDVQCRRLAKELPQVFTKVKKTVPVTGSQLIKSGKHQDKHGYDIIPGNIYNRTIEIQVPINHADRIKKQYRAKGEQGVADYIKWAKSAAKWQQNAVNKTIQAAQQQQQKKLINKIKNFVWKIISKIKKPQLPSIRA